MRIEINKEKTIYLVVTRCNQLHQSWGLQIENYCFERV